jgi:HK97 family phage major capsid protein
MDEKTIRIKLCESLGLDPTSAQPDEIATAVDEAVKLAGDLQAQHNKDVDADAVKKLGDFVNARTDEIKAAAVLAQAAARSIPAPRTADAGLESIDKAAGDIMTKAAKHGIWRALDLNQPTLKQLMEYETDDPHTRLLQDANDDLRLMAACTHQPVHQLDRYGKFMSAIEPICKAMNTSTDSNWVPTSYSPNLIRTVYESTDVLKLFPRIEFPAGSSTLSIPVQGTTDASIYATGEATSDDDQAKYTASQPNTATSVSVTAPVLTARVVMSYEFQEDSIIPVMEFVRQNIITTVARGQDDAIINGDTTATHVHTGITAANDHRKVFDGLIDRVKATTTANVDVSTDWTYESILKPLLYMRQYADPANTVLLVSHPVFTQLNFLTGTQTARPYVFPSLTPFNEDPKTNRPARLPYRIIPSAMVMSNVTAAGIYDGTTTTYSDAFWVHLPSWVVAMRKEFTLSPVDRPEQGQTVLVGRTRFGFKHLRGTELTTALLYGRLTVSTA